MAPARSMTSSATDSASSETISKVATPRAAVSIVARFQDKYVLVKRGKEPNKGLWSLPGGKIELGEKSLAAAKRELQEETGLSAEEKLEWNFRWCEEGPISTTDSIHISHNSSNTSQSAPNVNYHYVISHWFVEIKALEGPIVNDTEQDVPQLIASDDASDAMWFDLVDIRLGIERGEITPGVEKVLVRSKIMAEKGLLG